MKKLLLLALLLLPLGAYADNFNDPIIWIFAEKADLDTDDPKFTGVGVDTDFKQKYGFGVSHRFSINFSNLAFDLGIFGSGGTSSNIDYFAWSLEMNVMRRFGEKQYIFIGPIYTYWDIQDYDDIDPGLGIQFGYGFTVNQDDNARLIMESGFKIHTGVLKADDREFDLRSETFFIRAGLLIKLFGQ